VKEQLDHSEPRVLWAILAKDGERVLNLYLECLLSQDFPLSQIFLYVRTNDNNDNTSEMLRGFLADHGKKFLGHYFDDSSVNSEIRKYEIHEWNFLRLKIMGQLRQESLDYAREGNFDFYFVSDVDNFIIPTTLKSLISLNISAVAPLLKMVIPEAPTKSENIYYSTFHDKIDSKRGGFIMTNRLRQIATGEAKGIFEVDLVHCTYLLRRDVFEKVNYLFQDDNYEYRNFALSLKESLIPQFVDATRYYGCLTLSEAIDASSHLLSVIIESQEIGLDRNETVAPLVPEIVVITIPASVKRQETFRVRHPFLNYSWFMGTTGSEIDQSSLVDIGLIDATCTWKKTSIANALSHRALWERAVLENICLVILEDDACLVRDFSSLLASLLKETGEFDFISLGYNWDAFLFMEMYPDESGVVKVEFNQSKLINDFDQISNNYYTPRLFRLRSAFGNCAYVISPKGAKLLLNAIYPLSEHVVAPAGTQWSRRAKSKDTLMNLVYRDSRSFVSLPPLAFVKNEHSDSTVQVGINSDVI
jgi:GR25 family glycosyltransferase involved in LPS biosynthesis